MIDDRSENTALSQSTNEILTAHTFLIGFALGAIRRLDRSLFDELTRTATETAAKLEQLSPGNACSREVLKMMEQFREPTKPALSVVQGGKSDLAQG